jgi:DNA-binding transcriptional LysR family regulator
MIANMHSMDWDDLRYFLAVAERGSLSGASRQLGVNHSTVFRRINRFEEETGVRLFERLPDGYQLTQAGEEMQEHASKIRDEVDKLSLRVIGKDVEPAGVVRVTAPDSLAYNFINRYLKEFLHRYPSIDVELNVSNSSLDLSRRETDIAVRATSSPPGHLVGQRAFSVRWAFYASKEYLASVQASPGIPVKMKDLEKLDLIGPDGHVGLLKPYRNLEKCFTPHFRVRANSLSAIAALGKAGNGIALLPDDQVQSGMQRLFAMEPECMSDIWILTHPELRATERVRLLSRFLLESFRNDEYVN